MTGAARSNDKVDAAARDGAVDDLIGLVGAVDGICQAQARADAGYFVAAAGRAFDAGQVQAIERRCSPSIAGNTSSPASRVRASASGSAR
jgi:hypothetical protein